MTIFQFTATFVGKESPVNFTKDIYIGTVPMSRREMKSCIAGMFNQPYVDSFENLADVPQKSKSQLSLTHIIAQAVTQVSWLLNITIPGQAKINFRKFNVNVSRMIK